ncbi:hypothetical protein PM082_015166 [Marasmius tenuissimus]|nr:hypothetical protein PM082_015166 [Marasmius tenuissimus]
MGLTRENDASQWGEVFVANGGVETSSIDIIRRKRSAWWGSKVPPQRTRLSGQLLRVSVQNNKKKASNWNVLRYNREFDSVSAGEERGTPERAGTQSFARATRSEVD